MNSLARIAPRVVAQSRTFVSRTAVRQTWQSGNVTSTMRQELTRTDMWPFWFGLGVGFYAVGIATIPDEQGWKDSVYGQKHMVINGENPAH